MALLTSIICLHCTGFRDAGMEGPFARYYMWKIQISKNLPNWQVVCQTRVVENDLKVGNQYHLWPLYGIPRRRDEIFSRPRDRCEKSKFPKTCQIGKLFVKYVSLKTTLFTEVVGNRYHLRPLYDGIPRRRDERLLRSLCGGKNSSFAHFMVFAEFRLWFGLAYFYSPDPKK